MEKRNIVYGIVFAVVATIIIVSLLYGVQWLYDMFSGTGYDFYGHHIHHGLLGLILTGVGIFGFWHWKDDSNESIKYLFGLFAFFGVLLMAHDFFAYGDFLIEWIGGL